MESKSMTDFLAMRVLPALTSRDEWDTALRLAVALGKEELERFKAAHGDVMGPLKVGDVVFVKFVAFPFSGPRPLDYHVWWSTVVRVTKKYVDVRDMEDEQTWPSEELMHTRPVNAWRWHKHATRLMLDTTQDLRKREFWTKMKPNGLPPKLVMRATKEDFVSGRVLEAERTRYDFY